MFHDASDDFIAMSFVAGTTIALQEQTWGPVEVDVS
jgi:hypothetical protein